jgi:hypothetical protein
MRNSFNEYIQVDKGLFDEIQEMKKREASIPVYYPSYIELGDLKTQSKYEIMKKVKHNVDEAEKRYENDEAKGKIERSGYTRFVAHENYVFPALSYLFDLDGLARQVNAQVEKQCDKAWDETRENKEGFLTKRDYPVTNYIRFIKDVRQKLIWIIEKAKDIRDIQFKVSFDLFDVSFNNSGIMAISKVTFLLSSGDDSNYHLVIPCTSFSCKPKKFDYITQVGAYFCQENLCNEMVKLSEWKQKFDKMIDEYDIEKYKNKRFY